MDRTLIGRHQWPLLNFPFAEKVRPLSHGLSEHTAPFDALVHVLEGDADITIAGQVHQVPVGEMIVMPAHEPHALAARTAFKMLLTMIRSA
jgi:quercetin dioxygenase-like cupin family protein